jgi:hypothetical protein
MPNSARAQLIAARLGFGLWSLASLWGLTIFVGQEGSARGQGAAVAPTRDGALDGARPGTGDVELAVNGPEGSVLFVDGQAAGRLPLLRNLLIRPGPHRFSLEKGGRKLESEALSLPPDRQAELNLAITGRSLVAVLHITPGLLLLLLPERLGGAQQSAIVTAVAAAARKQHAVLIDDKKAGRQRPSALLRCIAGADCHEPLATDDQISYVLSLRIEGAAGDAASGRLRAALLDVRTRELSATAEEPFDPSERRDLAPLSAQIEAMTARLLNETTTRPRGSLAVTTEPAGARVLLDGRWLGLTPFQKEVFAGSRALVLSSPGYTEHSESVRIDPGQARTIRLTLQPAAEGASARAELARPEAARPLWRVAAGGVALGGGVVLLGFGTSALVTNGRCLDAAADPTSCSPYYDTTRVGAGLIGAGAALSLTGIVLLSLPPRSGRRQPATTTVTPTATAAAIDSAAMRTRY